jgi:hypothetical protein
MNKTSWQKCYSYRQNGMLNVRVAGDSKKDFLESLDAITEPKSPYDIWTGEDYE